MIIREIGGLVGHFFTRDIFTQWWELPVLIEDYPYAGMDYQEDLVMPRLPW